LATLIPVENESEAGNRSGFGGEEEGS